MNSTRSKVWLVLWFVFATITSQSQMQRLERRIDSAIASSPFKENYRYWYGSSSSDLTDFRMDTISGRLVSFHFKYFSNDTIVVNYYFLDNYLVKMESYRISKGKDRIINRYYFDNEQLVR